MLLRFLRSLSSGAIMLLVIIMMVLPAGAASHPPSASYAQWAKATLQHITPIHPNSVDPFKTHIAYPMSILRNRHGSASPNIGGFSASQLQQAYGINQLSQQGSGVTIAIIDACGNAHPQADLDAYDAQFGLPNTTIEIVQPQGTPCSDPQGWGIETDIDLQMAHAFAPYAHLVLEESAQPTFADLDGAASDAFNNHSATVVSMSFGGGEFSGETGPLGDGIFLAGNAKGVSFTASSGNSGCGAEYPAASPDVTSVGGTSLFTQKNGAYLSESAWNGSGGGLSTYESRPTYQNGFNSSAQRGIPDVVMDADPNTGVSMYDSDIGGFNIVGGIGVATALWAGVIADANRTFQNVDSALYSIAKNPGKYASDYHDITSGSSGGICKAKKGYDYVTGLGTDVGNKLVPDLKGSPPPPTGWTGSEAFGSGNPSGKSGQSSSGMTVNTLSGNFYHTFTDCSIPGRGLPLLFSRTYNAGAASQNSPLGYAHELRNEIPSSR